MSGMIDRVARAIADANMEDYDETPNLHRELALAAVRALREPTEEMAGEGLDAIDVDWNGRKEVPTANSSRVCWQAMIDSILSDAEGR